MSRSSALLSVGMDQALRYSRFCSGVFVEIILIMSKFQEPQIAESMLPDPYHFNSCTKYFVILICTGFKREHWFVAAALNRERNQLIAQGAFVYNERLQPRSSMCKLNGAGRGRCWVSGVFLNNLAVFE